MSNPADPSSADDVQAALREALERLLAPLAQLCLAKGMPFAVVEEMLKRAFVESARAQQTPSLGPRDISRVSAATGLTRREVTRITLDETARAALRPSPATQIFTRWMGNRRLHDRQGNPKPLKRQGKSPSFEALAQSVTRDVHPRTLLEELCRLGLAQLDPLTDMVSLLRHSVVPGKDKARAYAFLGNNVGDHLAAAVENVVADEPAHLEQAIFADELSVESLRKARELVKAQWKDLLKGLVPQIEALVEDDIESGRVADQRLRVGLYSYRAPMDAPTQQVKDES